MLFATDTYKTIEKTSEGLFRERGSKFIAYAHPVNSEQQVKEILQDIKNEHPTARHWCYAYFLGPHQETYRANDDGEPSGTAGKPILNQIRSFQLTNVLVVVVRYFGGTLLGVPGLINAYKEAAKEALQNATIIERYVTEYYLLQFDYSLTNQVMKIIKQNHLEIISQNMELECVFEIAVRKSLADKALALFNNLEGLILKYIKTT